jgi:hypothetical protein
MSVARGRRSGEQGRVNCRNKFGLCSATRTPPFPPPRPPTPLGWRTAVCCYCSNLFGFQERTSPGRISRLLALTQNWPHAPLNLSQNACRVIRWTSTDVSEEIVAFIFGAEEKRNKSTCSRWSRAVLPDSRRCMLTTQSRTAENGLTFSFSVQLGTGTFFIFSPIARSPTVAWHLASMFTQLMLHLLHCLLRKLHNDWRNLPEAFRRWRGASAMYRQILDSLRVRYTLLLESWASETGPAGLGTKIDCAVEGQHKCTQPTKP